MNFSGALFQVDGLQGVMQIGLNVAKSFLTIFIKFIPAIFIFGAVLFIVYFFFRTLGNLFHYSPSGFGISFKKQLHQDMINIDKDLRVFRPKKIYGWTDDETSHEVVDDNLYKK